MDEAAIDFAKTYNDDSIRKGIEIGTLMYQDKNGMFYYEIPYTNKEETGVQHLINPNNNSIVAMLHTHGKYDSDKFTEFFSFGERVCDTANAQESNLISYVVTPGGRLIKYTPTGDRKWDSYGKIDYINDINIPSDVNAGDHRITNIDAENGESNVYKERKIK